MHRESHNSETAIFVALRIGDFDIAHQLVDMQVLIGWVFVIDFVFEFFVHKIHSPLLIGVNYCHVFFFAARVAWGDESCAVCHMVVERCL